MFRPQDIPLRMVRAFERTEKRGQESRDCGRVRRSRKSTIGLALALLVSPFFFQSLVHAQSSSRLPQKIQHELLTLPFYSVFDNLSAEVGDNGNVVLRGQVTRPTLRTSAENVIERLEGVTSIDNQVEILPVSMTDDQIRLATFRAIYDDSVLFTRYATRAIPPIHIIVKDGNVTLVGIVAHKADKDLAKILVNGVPGVISVRNHLVVEGKERNASLSYDSSEVSG